MKFSEIIIALVVVIAIGIIGYIFGYSQHGNTVKIQHDTTFITETVSHIDTVHNWKYYIKHDSIWVELPKDTVLVGKEPDDVFSIVADTTYEDSSLTASIRFVSPYALSKYCYFVNQFTVRQKERIIEKIIEPNHSFWDNFVIVGGVGMTTNFNNTTAGVSVTAGYKLLGN